MLQIRRANERGHADHGWLDSHHTFSFGSYYDPRHMGFRALRVINEDRVRAGAGFPTHRHEDMEIISYVLSGGLEHKDSLGTGSVIRPGDVQRMSAGTGVAHSEYNHSKADPVHFLQIWLVPERRGLAPSYEQRHFSEEDRRGRLRLVAAPAGPGGAVALNQDARLYATLLAGGEEVTHPLAPGRHAYVHVARGAVLCDGQLLQAGDGAAISQEGAVTLRGVDEQAGEVLLFDLA